MFSFSVEVLELSLFESVLNVLRELPTFSLCSNVELSCMKTFEGDEFISAISLNKLFVKAGILKKHRFMRTLMKSFLKNLFRIQNSLHVRIIEIRENKKL